LRHQRLVLIKDMSKLLMEPKDPMKNCRKVYIARAQQGKIIEVQAIVLRKLTLLSED